PSLMLWLWLYLLSSHLSGRLCWIMVLDRGSELLWGEKRRRKIKSKNGMARQKIKGEQACASLFRRRTAFE
ncbi:MAG: hypothetical protein ACRCT2_09290, partial [Plesiomonas shigelloides]